MNENIFRTGPPAWSLRAADRVDAPESRGHRRAAVNFRRPQAGVLAGPLDEFAVDEDRAGTDQGDEMRRVDGAPPVLG
jgi:hypothetical protein